MRPVLHARLVNGPFDDAGLYIQFRLEKRAVMFDLGEINALSAREVLKLTHVFVSHTHIDHFAGFDRLLRIILGRPRTLHLYGPAGFAANVAGKLAGYTWNLLEIGAPPLILEVTEVHSDRLLQSTFTSQNRFHAKITGPSIPFEGCLLQEPAFRIDCDILDHQIPSLAFSLTEEFHINIMVNRLTERKLQPGPWLNTFKKALYHRQDPAHTFVVPAAFCPGGDSRFRLGDLADAIAHITSGQKISYVVDAAGHAANLQKIASLVQHSDQLFIESTFLSRHDRQAAATAHLTAAQAGAVAALAGVKQAIPFHFSSRYDGQTQLLLDEFETAFAPTGLAGDMAAS